MPNGSSAFLVDTNVLVYAYDSTDKDKQAQAIACWKNSVGAVSER